METAIDITPAFAETAPAFAETAPAFAETAPAFAETAPAFAETAADINAAPDTAGTTPEPCPPHRRYLCRHIFTDGHRCGSPALRGEAFCYYHHTSRPPKPAAGKSRHIDAWEPFTLGLIEDRASALLVGSQIMTRIASNDLDPTRAGHLIRCLQTIGRFLPSEAQAKRTGEATAAEALIEDPIQDETLGTIAPIAEFPPDAVIEAAAVDEPNVAREVNRRRHPAAAARCPEDDRAAADEEPAPPAGLIDYKQCTSDEQLYLCITIFCGYEPDMPRPPTLTREAIEAHFFARRKMLGMPNILPEKLPSDQPAC